MANPLEIYQYAKKGVDEGRLRAINRLAGQTLTALDSAQRDASMRALNGVDPMAGYKVQQQLQQDAQATQDRQQKAAAGLASAWLSTANAPPSSGNTFTTPLSPPSPGPLGSSCRTNTTLSHWTKPPKRIWPCCKEVQAHSRTRSLRGRVGMTVTTR